MATAPGGRAVQPFLALNGGSSSLKYAYYADGKPDDARRGSKDGVKDQAEALGQVLEDIGKLGDAPKAVGHRLVHGGAELSAPARVTDEVLKKLKAALPFAPLHLPSEIAAIEAVRDRFGGFDAFPQVVCFDTYFHRTLPEVAHRYALPEAAVKSGIRRYGFHGLSYEHVVARYPLARTGKVVIAHLGSGSSMVAVQDGESIDTTMGLTPTGGLVMGTRTGDLDPGVVLRLLREGSSVDALEKLLNAESGLKALTGETSDMKKIVAARATDPRAQLAFAIYAHTARKHLLGMAASLGGLDALIFTGGIGEHAPEVRDEVIRGLAFAGIEPSSGKPGRVTVQIVPTDEEERILHHAEVLLGS